MTDQTIMIEAEDMQKHGFRTVHGDKASGGDLVRATKNDAKLTTTFDGPSACYDLTLRAQDETDGVSKIKIFVEDANGQMVEVGTIMLDQQSNGRGSDNGGFTDFTLEGINIPSGSKIEIQAWKDGGEMLRIDKLSLTPKGPIVEKVCLLEESFDSKNLTASANIISSDFEGKDGKAKTSGSKDGELLFRDVDLSGVDDVEISFKARVASGSFEKSGSMADFFRVEVIDQDGTVILLDEFRGNGKTLTGSETGQSFNSSFDTLSWTLPDTVTSAQIRITSDISASHEIIEFDGLSIKGVESDTPPPPDLPPSAVPGQVCIDFDVFADGSQVEMGDTGSLVFEGVTFTADRSNDGENDFDDAMIFDAANPTGGDNDLFQPGKGNVLIISEDNDSSDPDDNARGGTIIAELDVPSTVSSVDILDTETRNGATIDLLDVDGNLLAQFPVPQIVDGGIQTVSLGDTENVKTVVFNFKSSGAIDSFKFTPPEQTALGKLGDTVFFDTDFDGIQDAGEGGVEGVTVELTGAGADGQFGTADDVSDTQLTDANGNYLFEDLEFGDYKVTFSNIPAGFAYTTPNVGGDDAVDSDAVIMDPSMPTVAMTQTTTLTADDPEDLTLDAGIVQLAGLGDFVFLDADGDGIQDDGEAGLEGVVVNLLDANMNFLDTTTTDANGLYQFIDLMPGDYIVEFVAPETPEGSTDGLTFTLQDQVDPLAPNPDAVDSDADPTTGKTGIINLEPGEFDPTIDAGLKPCFDVPDTGLIGVSSLFTLPPLINFDEQGQTTYDADTNVFTVMSRPSIGLILDPTEVISFGPFAKTQVILEIDENGDLVDGASQSFEVFRDENDNGVVDGNEVVFLQGEVVAFGSQNAGVSDNFDLIVDINGGTLASEFDDLIGVSWVSESSTFNGDFTQSFSGEAKGQLGNIGVDCICE